MKATQQGDCRCRHCRVVLDRRMEEVRPCHRDSLSCADCKKEKHRKASRKWKAANLEKAREADRKYRESDGYITKLLRTRGIPVTPENMDRQRFIVIAVRLKNQLKRAVNETTRSYIYKRPTFTSNLPKADNSIKSRPELDEVLATLSEQILKVRSRETYPDEAYIIIRATNTIVSLVDMELKFPHIPFTQARIHS